MTDLISDFLIIKYRGLTGKHRWKTVVHNIWGLQIFKRQGVEALFLLEVVSCFGGLAYVTDCFV